jgi:hypothetical protein
MLFISWLCWYVVWGLCWIEGYICIVWCGVVFGILGICSILGVWCVVCVMCVYWVYVGIVVYLLYVFGVPP